MRFCLHSVGFALEYETFKGLQSLRVGGVADREGLSGTQFPCRCLSSTLLCPVTQGQTKEVIKIHSHLACLIQQGTETPCQ